MGYPQYEPYPPAPLPPASGGTAITAGVLACIGSAGQLLGGGVTIVLGVTGLGTDLADYDSTGLFAQHWFKAYALVTGVLALITAILLGVGAIMTFTRKPLGRALVVAGCAVVVITGIAEHVVTLRYTTTGGGAAAIGSGVSGLIGLVFPIATTVLALIPPTTRWLNSDPAAAYAPPVARYPYGPAIPPAGPVAYSPGSGRTPYSPTPTVYPQYGSSAGATAQAGSVYSGTDQAGTQPASPAGTHSDWSANPPAAPTYPQPDPAKPQPDPAIEQSDPTTAADDSVWRRPSSE
ncbi:hypothetical protein ACQP1G_01040 [Nocardia sp. CA-107356]|uniref:hypothetical protein n=1 Tax=Nocardia sp. CA-107356 TaxID=3239972 RepID=UPI003D8A5F5D